MVRRVFILALALSLVGIGPAPLSACALLSSAMAECAAPGAQSQCDQMDLHEGQGRLAAPPDLSCCLAQAPVPVSQYQAPEVAVASVPAVAPEPILSVFFARDLHAFVPVQDTSPPGLQSLLCTFLI